MGAVAGAPTHAGGIHLIAIDVIPALGILAVYEAADAKGLQEAADDLLGVDDLQLVAEVGECGWSPHELAEAAAPGEVNMAAVITRTSRAREENRRHLELRLRLI